MILDICNIPETLKVLKMVKTILLILRIVVPILIIVFGMKNYLNAIQNSDELVKANKKIVVMSVSAAIFFFIPSFINIVLRLVSTDSNDYYACMENATTKGISNAYVVMANKYVLSAENYLNMADYQEAISYLRNVDNETERKNLESRLDKVEYAFGIVDDMNNLSASNFSEQSKLIEEKIDSLDNESMKEILNEKLAESKEKVFNFVGDYPVVPFDEIDFYKKISPLSGITLSNFLASKGSSVEELNNKIQSAVYRAGVGTRQATVAAAITLIGSMAEYKKKLPYYWGGKRNKLGVDGGWGVYRENGSCNSSYFATQEGIDNCRAGMSIWGMDCSGFVNWAVVQGVQEKRNQKDTNNGTKVKLDPDKAVCKIGDALKTSGHITLIVGIDDANKRYIIAEESMGMEIRSIPYNGKRKGSQYWCNDLSHNYIN